MNRERFAWSVSVLLLALLAFQIPQGLAQRDNDYAFVRTLVDIHRQVSNSYVEPVEQSKLETAAINGMLNTLDPYTVYVPPAEQERFDQSLDGNFKGVGIQLNQRDDGRVEVITPIDGSPAFKAGIQPGDIIVKVDGEALKGLKLDPDILKKIKGAVGSSVMLTVQHDGSDEMLEYTLKREEVIVPTLKGYSRKVDNTWDYYVTDEPKIAYVRLTQFTPDSYEKLRVVLTELQKNGMAGLVFDLRWNPGGRLDEAVKIINMLVPKGTIVTTKGRNRPEHVEKADGKNTLPYFPMVVLINEHSASASEIVSGSLMDNRRAVVVGTRSYGKGSVQELIKLDGETGGELKMTVAYYYLPSGRLVHKKKDATDWGVEPQINVPMDEATERGVAQARYEQELVRRPVAKLTTKPATKPATTKTATTSPSTQPVVDTQLKSATDLLRMFIILNGNSTDFVNQATTKPVSKSAPASTQPVGMNRSRSKNLG